MTNPLAIFQKLLRELFQFDCADLDFGIYRREAKALEPVFKRRMFAERGE